ncbi:hypothetical protein TorRG33x02_129270 [Trema orientale]|uniref:Uncharacterized protein n=1 Tax=Trema orientale TaxID=63057 RepID=A0A2P5F0P9_TREOI|nr:hypothetical protein TorRG33x02_129270 [Trema orientale]
MLPLFYHPRKLVESTQSQRPLTKPTSAALEASTSATSSSGHAYISASNYKISTDTSILNHTHLRYVHLSSNSSGHQELPRKFQRKKIWLPFFC